MRNPGIRSRNARPHLGRGGWQRFTAARRHPGLCAVVCLLVATSLANGESRIWIDSDPSFGAPYREVDDAFALVLAFHSPERRVAGISTTYGNAGVKRTTTVARNLVRRFGAPAGLTQRDVYEGSAGPRRRATRATDALAAALRREKLTYIALGPLTNLATLLELHPDLATRLDRVIFVGGQTPGQPLAIGPSPGHGLRIHDANVFKDPAAVRVVLRTKVPLVLAPPEAGGEVTLTRDDARRMTAGGPAARFLQRGSRVWLWFWTSIVKHRGGPLFDSLGILAAFHPEFVHTEQRYASVTGAGELLAAEKPFPQGRPVTFCRGINSRANREMMARLLRDDGAAPVD